ncbi:MAG TPA: sulfatase-like hydrolase/transferase, partial [Planctomycetaceae bacterium]|nr:sulfatase-like hydrolase/transferase [Planctomycetaceae bacterium]
PVCSVARTTLITSVYAPRLGTQYHRKIHTIPLPEGWKMFPAILNEAGYYTTNHVKTDYNAEESPDTWNESSRDATWRNRRDKSQPFFHMQSFAESHESTLHFSREQMENQKTDTDPASVTLAPYHPDTSTFRYTYARYHDRIKVIDKKIGEVVKQLEEDGLLEDTFVFYFGDHGGVLPRGKGYVYESGLHVPLVVRVPKKYEHLVTLPVGSRTNGFVSFIDFGPTLLNLAGLDVPAYMDGKPFLGPNVSPEDLNARDETFGHADRFDEKYEMVRTLRKGNLKYHRNYQGYYPDGLQNNYRYNMLAYREWRDLYEAGKLNEVQSAFFQSKPPEALYDLEKDPHETVNLAGDQAYADRLGEMRNRLGKLVREMPDLSIMPEPIMIQMMKESGREFREHLPEMLNFIAQAYEIADLAVLPFDRSREELQKSVTTGDQAVNYWALTVCCQFGKSAASLEDVVREQLTNRDLLIRLRAAEFLAIIGAEKPQATIMDILKTSEDPVVNLMVLQSVVFLRDVHGYKFEISPDDVTAKIQEVERRIEYLSQPE